MFPLKTKLMVANNDKKQLQKEVQSLQEKITQLETQAEEKTKTNDEAPKKESDQNEKQEEDMKEDNEPKDKKDTPKENAKLNEVAGRHQPIPCRKRIPEVKDSKLHALFHHRSTPLKCRAKERTSPSIRPLTIPDFTKALAC